jgi:nitroreductase
MKEEAKTFFKVILDRRSIRKYTNEKISEEDLMLILESGRQAPSGENAQPWRFIVVRDQKNKEFLSYIGKNASGRRFTGEFLSQQMQKRFEGLQDPEKRKNAFIKLTSGNVSALLAKQTLILSCWGKKMCGMHPLIHPLQSRTCFLRLQVLDWEPAGLLLPVLMFAMR